MTTAANETVTKVAAKAAAGEATFEALMAKPRRSLRFPVTVQDADGEEQQVDVKFLAINAKAYDNLTADHPPTSKEKALGATYNVDTFAPALISAVSCTPKLTVDQATALYKSPEWSGGEAGNLFMNAARVCNSGLDVGFNGRD